MTHLELIGSISTLKITPSCSRLGFVRFELTSDGASLKIGKARILVGGGGHDVNLEGGGFHVNGNKCGWLYPRRGAGKGGGGSSGLE